MSPSIVADAIAAGFVYAITPGPGVLALLGIGAEQGRRAGASFLGGHLFGDFIWATVALVAIVGVHAVGSVVFDLLGLASGLYLLWLGMRALGAGSAGSRGGVRVRRPFRYGLTFGLSNPKAYPVAIATFTALLSARADELSWGVLPLLAYAILVAVVGAARVRSAYRRHEVLITRLSGLVFVGFAANALFHAAQGLTGQRARLPGN
jgi:threonine/homoserine/homoserine lactone efflux protein